MHLLQPYGLFVPHRFYHPPLGNLHQPVLRSYISLQLPLHGDILQGEDGLHPRVVLRFLLDRSRDVHVGQTAVREILIQDPPLRIAIIVGRGA